MANGASPLDLAQGTAVFKQTVGALVGGPWQALSATTNTTVTLTATNWNGGVQQTGVAINAGVTVYGNFTAVNITSAGHLVAYQLLQ
jgi:hypothetical protein